MMSEQDEVFEEATGVVMTGAASAVRAAEAFIRRRQRDQERDSHDTEQQTAQLQERYRAQVAAAERYYASPSVDRELATGSARDAAVAWQGAEMWAELEPERFSTHADRLNDTLRGQIGTDPRAALAAAGQPVAGSEEFLAGLVDRGRAANARSDVAADETTAGQQLSAANDDLALAEAAPDATTARDAREDADAHVDQAASAEGERDVDEATAEDFEAAAASYDTPERRTATENMLRTAGVPDEAVVARITSDRLNGQHPHTAAHTKASSTKAPRGRSRVNQRSHDSGLER